MILASLAMIPFAQSSLQLPTLFADHMVLQRGKPISVWGWDKPGQEVAIKLDNKEIKVVTDSLGKFQGSLPKMREGGPFKLTISGTSVKEVNDVLVGEVWVCSGQSNMEWTVVNTFDRLQAQSEANPNIRMFTVNKKISQTKDVDVSGSWAVAASGTVDNFSAVGFAFAKKLYRELNIPVGMIHTSWGGTPAEAWTSGQYLSKSPITNPIFERAELTRKSGDTTLAQYKEKVAVWERQAHQSFFDESNLEWTKNSFDDSSWAEAKMPHQFPAEFNGSFLYRKTVNLTASEASQVSTLQLGAIDDFDITYVNGIKVGATTMVTQNHWSTPRIYNIPSGLLKEGVNTVAIHAYDNNGFGGFSGSDTEMKLGTTLIGGTWKAKQGASHVTPDTRKVGNPPQVGGSTNSPNFPSTLYNGMLAPLAPYSIRGALWYQGESNAGRAFQYKTLLELMIQNWRADFKQGDFPFYIAQLANFMNPSVTQFDSAWAELRDAQDQVGQMKNCGTATIIDIGDAADIHPRNKRDVGERLALIALKKDYRKNVEWQGPRFKRMKVNGDKVIVELSHSNGLKTTDGSSPKFFAICGKDGKWFWADAEIVGKTVVLSDKEVPLPWAVRYAWQDNPGVNLVNGDGLPAMPFRTDDLPLLTQKNR